MLALRRLIPILLGGSALGLGLACSRRRAPFDPPSAEKFAILINGDTEPRHLKNITRAASVLLESGYHLSVLSPQPIPGVQPDFFAEPNLKTLERLMAGIRSDGDDVLVVYTTGHGSPLKGGGLVISGTSIPVEKLREEVQTLPFGTRTVVMDQCYSGNAAALWQHADNLFTSPDWKDRQTSCQYWAPNLWAPASVLMAAGVDLNRDGALSFQERFAYASHIYRRQFPQALPLFLPGETYRDGGIERQVNAAPFVNQVMKVKSAAALRRMLNYLEPGQYAVVDFSATWCAPCRSYAPYFDSLAANSTGQTLFIRATLETDEAMKEFDVSSFPTVRLYDHLGRNLRVPNREKPLEGLPLLALSDEAAAAWAVEQLKHGDVVAAITVMTGLVRQKKASIPREVGWILLERIRQGDQDAVGILTELVKIQWDLLDPPLFRALFETLPTNPSSIFVFRQAAVRSGSMQLFEPDMLEVFRTMVADGSPEAAGILGILYNARREISSDFPDLAWTEFRAVLQLFADGNPLAGEVLTSFVWAAPSWFRREDREILLAGIQRDQPLATEIVSRLSKEEPGYFDSGQLDALLQEVEVVESKPAFRRVVEGSAVFERYGRRYESEAPWRKRENLWEALIRVVQARSDQLTPDQFEKFCDLLDRLTTPGELTFQPEDEWTGLSMKLVFDEMSANQLPRPPFERLLGSTILSLVHRSPRLWSLEEAVILRYIVEVRGRFRRISDDAHLMLAVLLLDDRFPDLLDDAGRLKFATRLINNFSRLDNEAEPDSEALGLQWLMSNWSLMPADLREEFTRGRRFAGRFDRYRITTQKVNLRPLLAPLPPPGDRSR